MCLRRSGPGDLYGRRLGSSVVLVCSSVWSGSEFQIEGENDNRHGHFRH